MTCDQCAIVLLCWQQIQADHIKQCVKCNATMLSSLYAHGSPKMIWYFWRCPPHIRPTPEGAGRVICVECDPKKWAENVGLNQIKNRDCAGNKLEHRWRARLFKQVKIQLREEHAAAVAKREHEKWLEKELRERNSRPGPTTNPGHIPRRHTPKKSDVGRRYKRA